jgi:hypothetical protein
MTYIMNIQLIVAINKEFKLEEANFAKNYLKNAS